MPCGLVVIFQINLTNLTRALRCIKCMMEAKWRDTSTRISCYLVRLHASHPNILQRNKSTSTHTHTSAYTTITEVKKKNQNNIKWYEYDMNMIWCGEVETTNNHTFSMQFFILWFQMHSIRFRTHIHRVKPSIILNWFVHVASTQFRILPIPLHLHFPIRVLHKYNWLRSASEL